jgi:iron complex transport system substrate-binding protein
MTVLLFGLAAITALPVHAQSFPQIRTDALGRSVTVSARPQRIVSLVPAATEILFAVGAGNQVAGVTEYCNYPPETAAKTKVGGFSGITVNIEQLVMIKPDLVILSADMHQRIIELLDGLSIRSFAVEPRNFTEVYQTITTIGALTGNASGARQTIDGMRAKIARAEARRRGRASPAVFWELSSEPLMSAGGNTFISEALTLAGGRNIFAELPEQWPTVSVEQIIIRRPAWIIAGTDQWTPVDIRAIARRPGWSGIPAVRDSQIATVNSDLLYRYGPRLADAVLAISEILYKD